ncbi:MAG TPA: hypothetical protein VFA99_12145 [Acidobacteriaceae bacterium]|nr:hypothetical protein [Acidobacteriaceae bacterium]
MLLDEAESRTGERWQLKSGDDSRSAQPNSMQIFIGENGEIASMLQHPLRNEWVSHAPDSAFLAKAEGYTVRTLDWQHHPALVVDGNDARGVLYGVGYLLRHLELSPNGTALLQPLSISTAPQVPIRSHQIGYRYKNNTYDAWTLPMFEQQIRDLAVFGISGLQLVAPVSDDRATSPLYPAPAFDTVVGISRLLAKYGLDCDLYYPEMRKDYTDAATVDAEVKVFTALVKTMPRIDALYVPGGDPGHTAPGPLIALVAKETEVLHRYHPNATVWVSAQGFDSKAYAEFYALLKQQQPAWLTGVFFGPQSRDSFETQRANIPARYRMLFYPDIAHTMHAQFPVPQWDPVFALTEGREPIDPRPIDETHIYHHFARLHTGFVTYSEGVNDDVNKFLWTSLGWSSDADPRETLEEYSRYFFGPHIGKHSSSRVADAIFDLERDWRGPLASNVQIPRTLELLQQLNAGATPAQQNNWRFESLIYRANYDAYLQARLKVESGQEDSALRQLTGAPRTGSIAAMEAAEKYLQPVASASEIRTRIEDLAARLFQHARLQLSVAKYGASGIERGANLDRVDIPLNDRVWLQKKFSDIRSMPTEKQRLAALEGIAYWQHPVEGALYDDLGNPAGEPHLVRGRGFDRDPEMYETAIDGVADHTTEEGWRMSELSYAETLYEYPLGLHYKGLNTRIRYKLRIVYAGEEYTLPLELTANDKLIIHGPRFRKSNPETLDFDLPAEATATGSLDLKWNRPAGIGGGGRGRQVAEIWLLPER